MPSTTEPVNSVVAGSVVAAQNASSGTARRSAASASRRSAGPSNPAWERRIRLRRVRSAERCSGMGQSYVAPPGPDIPDFWNRDVRGAGGQYFQAAAPVRPASNDGGLIMSETNKALVIRFVDEFWSERNLEAADELMTPDVVIHQPEVGGIGGLRAFCTAMRTAFPDWHSTAEELVAEGDLVAERWTGRGTQHGEFQGIPATGRHVTVPGVVFYRIRDGKIAEFRGSFDTLSMLQQLGAIPATAGGTQ
jgi:steroid delta-isomerase-like uncharacterized protein